MINKNKTFPIKYDIEWPSFVIVRKNNHSFYTGTPALNAYKTSKSINIPSFSMEIKTENYSILDEKNRYVLLIFYSNIQIHE